MKYVAEDIFVKAGLKQVHGAFPGLPEDVAIDSRKVVHGTAFVALKGTVTDGHKYISTAIDKGSQYIICENLPDTFTNGICYIQVANSAIAAGELAAAIYDYPSENITVVGVTGTNGKTTIATLLHSIFTKMGYKCGLISTICIKTGSVETPATHTTPDAISLQQTLAHMVEENCSFCFMEISSHAIDQQRIAGLSLAGAVFTNLTHDHLDYHKTFAAYRDAKKQLFDNLPDTAFALTNIDDKNGNIMLQNTKAKKITYGLQGMADYKTRILENSFSGLHMMIDGAEIWSRLTGKFNALNITAVYGTAILLGQEKEETLIALSEVTTVEGRFDLIHGDNGVNAIVDYAHTPDALKNVITTINSIREGRGQLITVAGAGGDRDTSKRPEMGAIAASLSNRVILTSDNPRTEDPEKILDMIMAGVAITDRKKVLRITNRKEAIRTACALAQQGDIVLVAGKGHEKYQEINGIRHPFDDKAILREILITENNR